MMYENPRTVFQQKINNILPKESDSSQLFETIFKLQQLYTFERLKCNTKTTSDTWKILMELYTELGSVNFAKVITILKGKTINFPSEEEYQDSIITTLCYYYKEIEGLDWEQIKNKIEINKLNTIKFGIRVQQLKSFIDSQIIKTIKNLGDKNV